LAQVCTLLISAPSAWDRPSTHNAHGRRLAAMPEGAFRSQLRSCFEICTHPIGACIRKLCGYKRAWNLPKDSPFGGRDELLRALAICARLVYGTGFIDEETWGKFDPPLDGEGWRVIEQLCETRGSRNLIQAGCYVKDGDVAIVAYRGTVSFKGIMQDLSWWGPVSGRTIRSAIKEASSFYLKCAALHGDKKFYVTGHSLGGYIAEAVASYCDVDGACFNAPGPWSNSPMKNVTGVYRPRFEIHLTRSDPLALVFFPKPENSSHIGKPIWHDGKNHRICEPYMIELGDMQRVGPNKLPFDQASAVNQLEALEHFYPPPWEIDEGFEWLSETDSEQ